VCERILSNLGHTESSTPKLPATGQLEHSSSPPHTGDAFLYWIWKVIVFGVLYNELWSLSGALPVTADGPRWCLIRMGHAQQDLRDKMPIDDHTRCMHKDQESDAYRHAISLSLASDS
jgi:hypothetical protein